MKMSGFPRQLGRGLWVIAVLSSTLMAAEPLPSSQVDAAAVKALIERLESDRAAERATAAKELQTLGPGVLPHLPPPDRLTSPAARDAVLHIRNVLERALAKRSAQASTVTITRTATRSELAGEIAKHSGNPLGIAAGMTNDPRKVDWQDRPFWLAVDNLFSKSSERVSWSASKQRFEIEPRPAEQAVPVVAHDGAFRVEASIGKVKTTADNGGKSILRLNTLWQAEPRLRPLFLRIKTADWHGTAGTESVAPWNPNAEYELPFGDGTRQLAWPLDVLWSPPAETKNWTLQGRAEVHLAAMTETIVFDAAALRPNVQRRRGGVAIRIRKVEFQPDEQGQLTATIRINVVYDIGGPAFESHRVGVFYQHGRLIDPNGERIAYTDYEATQEAEGAVGVEYRFRNLKGRSADYKFQYEAPTLFLDVPIEVTFRDLLLPE
jgi:hypothetical protein